MEKELRKAFEEVTTKNVKAILQFSTETRKMLRVLEDKAIKLEEMVRNQNTVIEELRLQLSSIQMKVYNGGT